MDKVVKNIVMPVKFDSVHLAIVKQVAELAKEHAATLHLLYISECRYIFGDSMLPWFSLAKNQYTHASEKTALLQTWKRWVETQYGIKVTTAMNWGSWKKNILAYLNNADADLLVLPEQKEERKKFRIWKTPLEYIMGKSPCQVITLSAKNQTINDWKQIVIPITDFIPEQRIRTIIDIAKTLKLKIHLITVSPPDSAKKPNGFFFLTETLKRLKPLANIQVECKFLPMEKNPAYSYIQYTGRVGADVLLTNKK